jgi:hypothetical protein
MPRILSIHEYELAPHANSDEFEAALRTAREKGIPELPGLEDYYLLEEIKGARRDRYTAVWIYESRDAWTALWGTPDDPVPKEDYPENWKTWEDEVLAPHLSSDPDAIRFTSYRELHS